MILTLEELRQYVQTNETDEVLTLWLEGIEQTIIRHTNNNFKKYEVNGVIQYPADIKMGVVGLVKWKTSNQEKVGVASESLSRWTVTYSGASGDDSTSGYPDSMMGFLKPYMKARFGQGLSV